MIQVTDSQGLSAPSASSQPATVGAMGKLPVIIVSAHVVDRYRQRVLDCNDRRPFLTLVDEISTRVTDAIANGRVMNNKPKAFRLYRESKRQLPPDERFVQCDENVAFIVREISSGDKVVTTMLSRTGGTPG